MRCTYVSDSRLVKPGDVFVAIPGVKEDGAKYAKAAVEKGALRVCCSFEAAAGLAAAGIPAEGVAPAAGMRKWLGEAAAASLGRPSRKLEVWGVTGTNGKTTTTWILREFLGAEKCGMITTVETFTGRRTFASDHTTPDAVSLQNLFAEMVDAGLEHCVMEVSSHAAAMDRTAGTLFAGAAFTNLTEDHLDYHKTMAAYFEAKAGWIREVARTNRNAVAAICLAAPGGREMLKVAREAGLAIAPEMPDEFERYVRAASPLAGEYNVQNVLLAARLASAAGVAEEEIRAKVPRLAPRWGRLEKVETRSKADVFVDFAHTPDAIANVLKCIRGFAKGRIWIVFGAGGDRDSAKRPLMGRAAEDFADNVVLTSDNPRSESPEEIMRQIASGMKGRPAYVEADRKRAIFHALGNAEKGDVVVICGKGHETTQETAGVKHPFDDRLVAAEF